MVDGIGTVYLPWDVVIIAFIDGKTDGNGGCRFVRQTIYIDLNLSDAAVSTSMNQSINQSIKQTIKQSINQ